MNEFVERFASFWSDPDPDRLGELLADDVRLVQPITPETRTLAEGVEAFRQLFALFPDLRAVVHDSAVAGDTVYIHFTQSCTHEGRPISWDAVDRFVLGDDGRATERISFFDSQRVVQMLAPPAG